MSLESFLKQLKESIDVFPELYKYCKSDIVSIRHGQRWILARGVIRFGMGELLSEPHMLPTPNEIRHIAEICTTEKLITNLKSVTQPNHKITLGDTIIHLVQEKGTLRPYIFDLFEGKSLHSEFGGLGTLFRLSGEPLYSVTSALNYSIQRVLSGHYRSQASDLYQFIERATDVSSQSHSSVTLDLFLPTYSEITKVWHEHDYLCVNYECPAIFAHSPPQATLEISHKKPSSSMKILRTKPGTFVETTGYEPKAGLFLARERIPIDWPDGHFPREGIIRINLYHRGKKRLLCYYEEDLNPPEIDDALISLFSRVQLHIDSILERLDSELSISLKRLLLDVESEIGGLEVRMIAGSCKSIVEEVLSILQDDEEYRRIELNKTISRVKLLCERMKQIESTTSDTLLEHFESFSKYFESLNKVVNRGYHSKKEGLVDDDARALVAHLYLWLNDLFRLLESAGWTPHNRNFSK